MASNNLSSCEINCDGKIPFQVSSDCTKIYLPQQVVYGTSDLSEKFSNFLLGNFFDTDSAQNRIDNLWETVHALRDDCCVSDDLIFHCEDNLCPSRNCKLHCKYKLSDICTEVFLPQQVYYCCEDITDLFLYLAKVVKICNDFFAYAAENGLVLPEPPQAILPEDFCELRQTVTDDGCLLSFPERIYWCGIDVSCFLANPTLFSEYLEYLENISDTILDQLIQNAVTLLNQLSFIREIIVANYLTSSDYNNPQTIFYQQVCFTQQQVDDAVQDIINNCIPGPE